MTLSSEHQRLTTQACQYLSHESVQTNDVVTKIWGDKPIIISTYTHPSIDTEARIVTGDLMWQEITSQIEGALSEFHLAWEPSPPGRYKILEIPLPLDSNSANRATIDSGFAVIPWWLPATTENVAHFYNALLEESNWNNTAQALGQGLAQTGLEAQRTTHVLDNLKALQDIYIRVLNTGNNEQLSLAKVSEQLYRTIATELIGPEIVNFFKPKSGGLEQIGRRLNETLLTLDQVMPIESILQVLLPQGGQKLFVGTADLNQVEYIGYSVKKDQFAIDSTDTRTGNSLKKSNPITKDNLYQLLQEGLVFPTGKTLMMALTYVTSWLPIAHMGNDYGWREKVKSAMGAVQTFHQLFPDFADSWPFIIPMINNHAYTGEMVTMAGLFVLFKDNPNIADYVWQSLSTGRPINLEV